LSSFDIGIRFSLLVSLISQQQIFEKHWFFPVSLYGLEKPSRIAV
jgi:hypothetical protein